MTPQGGAVRTPVTAVRGSGPVASGDGVGNAIGKARAERYVPRSASAFYSTVAYRSPRFKRLFQIFNRFNTPPRHPHSKRFSCYRPRSTKPVEQSAISPASILAARSAARESQAETLTPSRSAASLAALRVSLGIVIVTRSRLML